MLGVLCLACEPRTPPRAAAPYFSERPFPALEGRDFGANPRLGITTSNAHLLVAFTPDADDLAIETAVTGADCTLVGAAPDLRIGVARLRGAPSWQALEAARKHLSAQPAVVAVVEDLLLGPELYPPRSTATAGSAGASTAYTRQWDPSDAHGGAWWVDAIHAPVAWNLRPALAWMHSLDPARRTPSVAVIDQGFQAHTDLRGVMSLDDGLAPDAPKGEVQANHGTAMVGLIAAGWNGAFADGVTPFARVAGRALRPLEATTADEHPGDFAVAMSQSIDRLRHRNARVVSTSLGLNWYQICWPSGDPDMPLARCDPKPTGPWAPDSRCQGHNVRQAMQEAAAVLRNAVFAAVAAGPVLFVTSAGNNAGSLENAGDFCRKGEDKFLTGLGDFPAWLGSPMAHLGMRDGPAVPVLVVGALAKPNNPAAAPTRAEFSSVGPHIMAPGADLTVLAGGQDLSTMVAESSGTSYATPIVAGAAAYLLALNPSLSTDDLKHLLLGEPQAVRGEPRPLAVLDLGRAVREMQVEMPDGERVPAARLLADLDDGTPDGFTRRDGANNWYTGRRKSWEAPRVDLADMRAFRDMWWMALGLGPTCDVAVPACDLNGDGQVDLPSGEPWPRNAFHARHSGPEDLALLARWWDGDRVQPIPKASLPALLHSADLHVDASKFLARAGASSLRLSLLGAQPEGAARLPDESGLLDLTIAGDDTIITTPYIPQTTLRVTVNSQTLTGVVDTHELAGDVDVFLNPCALVPNSGVGLLDPDAGQCREPDGDPTPAACREVMRSGGLFACFALSAPGWPERVITMEHATGETSRYRGYLVSQYNTMQVRMTDIAMVGGEPEKVILALTFPGTAPGTYAWRTDVDDGAGNDGFHASFLYATPGPPVGTRRIFEITADGGGDNTITAVGPVDGKIEGTFHGRGAIFQGSERLDGAQIHGVFRVERTADN